MVLRVTASLESLKNPHLPGNRPNPVQTWKGIYLFDIIK